LSVAHPSISPIRRGISPKRSIGILSTYPPTPCGLATFSAALAAGLVQDGADVRVVRVADGQHCANAHVVGELVNGSAQSVAAASVLLNQCDVVVIQHEYGVYGGSDGDEVVKILGDLRVPSIVIAHTILKHPTAHQRSILVEMAARADSVVVMSQAANDRLCSQFSIDSAKVITIPHGATIPTARAMTGTTGRPTLLTWGLLGPGKGIERVIDAMRAVYKLPTRPRYLVAGQTHPKVLAADGEAYRNARLGQAWRNGVAASVSFDATYRDLASLTALVQSATAVVLPYDSTDQVTSGVLVDAIAAGRPVISTAFPHAVELLASGAGMVVDHDDPDAMALALHRVLTEPDLLVEMAAEASRLAPRFAWGVVAQTYVALGERLLAERAAV
jgi:polysaccharide biosynthesis protein PslF